MFYFFQSSKKGSTLKGKNLPKVNKVIPFKTEPFCSSSLVAGKLTGSHKCLFCKQEKCLTALWTVFLKRLTKRQTLDVRGDRYIMKEMRVVPLAHDMSTGPLLYLYQI